MSFRKAETWRMSFFNVRNLDTLKNDMHLLRLVQKFSARCFLCQELADREFTPIFKSVILFYLTHAHIATAVFQFV